MFGLFRKITNKKPPKNPQKTNHPTSARLRALTLRTVWTNVRLHVTMVTFTWKKLLFLRCNGVDRENNDNLRIFNNFKKIN